MGALFAFNTAKYYGNSAPGCYLRLDNADILNLHQNTWGGEYVQ